MEKMLLKSTTRHVRIFTAEVVDEELKFHPNKLTLDLDPDNEFIWSKDSLNKINEKFNELIKDRAGKDLDDYIVNQKSIPYYLIDILDPKQNYSVYDFQKDFYNAYQKIRLKNIR